MPIKFDIETDELYIKGYEEGLRLAEEQLVRNYKYEVVSRMLRDGELPLEKIAQYVKVTIEFVQQVKKEIKI
jgi:hypothetical protein